MTLVSNRARWGFVLAAVLAIPLAFPPTATADPVVKIKRMQGEVDLLADGAKPFVLAGKASHLGKFTAYGEVEFAPGEEEGSLIGAGPVVLEAANGDLLVGVVAWEVGPPVGGKSAMRMHFAWRDAVEFSDGTVVGTDRFVDNRPAGLVVLPEGVYKPTLGDLVVGAVLTIIVDTFRKL